jgi:hypothetical protein
LKLKLRGKIAARDVEPEPSNPFEKSVRLGKRSGLYRALAASIRNRPTLFQAMHLKRRTAPMALGFSKNTIVVGKDDGAGKLRPGSRDIEIGSESALVQSEGALVLASQLETDAAEEAKHLEAAERAAEEIKLPSLTGPSRGQQRQRPPLYTCRHPIDRMLEGEGYDEEEEDFDVDIKKYMYK